MTDTITDLNEQAASRLDLLLGEYRDNIKNEADFAFVRGAEARMLKARRDKRQPRFGEMEAAVITRVFEHARHHKKDKLVEYKIGDTWCSSGFVLSLVYELAGKSLEPWERGVIGNYLGLRERQVQSGIIIYTPSARQCVVLERICKRTCQPIASSRDSSKLSDQPRYLQPALVTR